MKVQVWLRGYLRQYAPENAENGRYIQEAREGATIRELLDNRGIQKWSTHEIYLNGGRVKDDEVLKDGNHLRVYPRIFVGG